MPHTIKHCYQRVRYGVSERDAWNLDVHAAEVIARGMAFIDKVEAVDRGEYQEDWDLVKRFFTLRANWYREEADICETERQADAIHEEALQAFTRIYHRLWW